MTNFETNIITDITSSFSNLTTLEIHALIMFIILIIVNNLYTLLSLWKLGACSGNPIPPMIKMSEFHDNVIRQILITILFVIIFINTTPLNQLILIFSPFVLTVIGTITVAYFPTYLFRRD